MSFFKELKRRNVVRVAIAYVVVAWILIEAASVLFPGFGAPDWIFQVFATLVILGFPLALIFAWAFEVTPEGIKRAAELPAGYVPEARSHRKMDLMIIGLLVVALAVSVGLNIAQRDDAGVVRTDDDKSIAVLPFANLSPDPDNAFFAAGVHEDILTYLSKVKDLKVISRSSVMQYEDQTPTVRQVAEELGVAHVVEGSVRRAGDRVRITAQLIDARTDEHLWAENFDRELSDIFAIQTAVAQEIVAALQATLSPEEAQVISEQPTDNLEAYDLYLKARNMLRRTGLSVDEYTETIAGLLEQAVELDPEFAEAWALLANVDGDMYWFTYDRTPERLAHMKHAVDRAIALKPDSPDAHAALAEYYYRGFYDYEKSLEHLETAYELMPNNSEVLYNMGLTLRRLGRWTESVDRFEEAAALDPADVRTFQELLNTATDAHDPRAKYWNEELGRRFPESAPIAGVRAIYYMMEEGDVAAAREALETARPGADWFYVRASFEIPLWERDYETAVEKVIEGRETFDVVAPGSADVWVGWFLTLAGETERAQAYLEVGLAKLEADRLKPYAESYAWIHMYAAIGYALQGDRDEAIAACDQGQAILPERRDKVHGVNLATYCALVKGWTGDTEFLVSEIERLLPLANSVLGVQILRLDPSWDFIRDHPRVQALLAKHSD